MAFPAHQAGLNGCRVQNSTPTHEYLLPDTRDGPVTFRFPYFVTTLRMALMPRVLGHFTGRSASAEFFSANHPSAALSVTIAIIETFVRESEQRGKRPLILLLPGANSFRALDNWGTFDYAPLVSGLKAVNIDAFDAGQGLKSRLVAQNFCTLYVKSDCNGHYSIYGNTVVSEVIANELYRRGLVKQ